MPRASTWWMLVALTALGAALRLYGLDRQSLWTDELSTLFECSQPGLRRVFAIGASPDHVPAYWVLMYGWIRAVGDSESLLRLPSALFGIAAIPAMFALGRRWYGDREGLIAAGIVAVAWAPVYYSQEARPYALLLLVVLLSTAWLIDVVQPLRAGTTPAGGVLARYVVAASAATYTHYFGLMMVLLQVGTAGLLLLRRPRALRVLAAIYAAVLVLYVPCLIRALVIAPVGPDWLAAPMPRAVWQLWLLFFNQSAGVAWLVLATWALALGLSLVRRAQPAPQTLLLIAWLVAPVAFVYAYSQLVAPRFLDRTLLVVAPAAYLLLARALTQLPLATVTAPALLGLLLVHLVAVKQYYAQPVKEQFREAAAHLVAHDTPDTPAMVLACTGNRAYFDYYLARMGSPRRVERRIRTSDEAAEALAHVAERQPRELWLLAGHRRCDPALLSALSSRMTLVDERQLLDAAVWRFRSGNGSGQGSAN